MDGMMAGTAPIRVVLPAALAVTVATTETLGALGSTLVGGAPPSAALLMKINGSVIWTAAMEGSTATPPIHVTASPFAALRIPSNLFS